MYLITGKGVPKMSKKVITAFFYSYKNYYVVEEVKHEKFWKHLKIDFNFLGTFE